MRTDHPGLGAALLGLECESRHVQESHATGRSEWGRVSKARPESKQDLGDLEQPQSW